MEKWGARRRRRETQGLIRSGQRRFMPAALSPQAPGTNQAQTVGGCAVVSQPSGPAQLAAAALGLIRDCSALRRGASEASIASESVGVLNVRTCPHREP